MCLIYSIRTYTHPFIPACSPQWSPERDPADLGKMWSWGDSRIRDRPDTHTSRVMIMYLIFYNQ